MKQVFLTLLLILLGSCTTMNKSDCLNASWEEVGKVDGEKGYSKLRGHNNNCGEFGIRVDQRAYERGFAKGIKSYCTYQRGFEMGHVGDHYYDKCPGNFGKDFMKGYVAGKKLYGKQQFYEKQMQLKEEESHRSALYQERLMGNMNRRTCKHTSECKIQDQCQHGKCAYTGRACIQSRQCIIRGSCERRLCIF